MPTTVRLVLVLVALVAAGCSEPDDGPVATPSTAFPSPTPALPPPNGATPTGTGPTAIATGPAPGELTRGRISFQVSGQVEAESSLETLVSAVVAPPPGALAIVWASQTDATVVGIGGTSFVGERRTSPTLTITITVQSGGDIATFVSLDGECEVSIVVAERDRVAGSFTCDDLTSDTGRVAEVSASFEAAR